MIVKVPPPPLDVLTSISPVAKATLPVSPTVPLVPVFTFLFKVIVALLDTPLLYLFVWIFRMKFNLKVGEEIKLS